MSNDSNQVPMDALMNDKHDLFFWVVVVDIHPRDVGERFRVALCDGGQAQHSEVDRHEIRVSIVLGELGDHEVNEGGIQPRFVFELVRIA